MSMLTGGPAPKGPLSRVLQTPSKPAGQPQLPRNSPEAGGPGLRTHNLLSDGVVGRLQVAQHLGHNLLGIAAVTHGIEQVHRPLPHTHVPLCLQGREGNQEASHANQGWWTAPGPCGPGAWRLHPMEAAQGRCGPASWSRAPGPAPTPPSLFAPRSPTV